eukprot:COSAG03_NODE_3258_length_2120_cov_4.196932_2_plen_86_part_00
MQIFAIDEPERDVAREPGRDGWAIACVSASLRISGVGLQCWCCCCVCGGMGSVTEWADECRYLDSTSLSGTLPESLGEMAGLTAL